jgi:hypothetical protein
MAVGGAMAGLGIAYLGFSASLAVLAVASLAIGVPAVLLWRSSSKTAIPKNKRLLQPLNPKGRPQKFWLASVALMFNSLATYPLVNLLFPVFMSQKLGYNYIIIGILFMLYYAVSAIATWATVKYSLGFKRAAILSAVSVVASVFLAGPALLFPAFLLTLAFVRGCGVGYFEHTVLKIAKNSQNLSVDIGWLHAPMRLAEFSSLVAGGFLAQALGYAPVFIATGVFFGIYAFLSLYVIKS